MTVNGIRPKRPLLIRLLCICSALVLLTAISQGTRSPARADTPIGAQDYYAAQSFDTCFQPSEGGLDDWFVDTPWYVYGFYLGGSAGGYVGCTPPSTSTLDYAINIGYAVAPIWYGYQMPTSCGQSYYPDQISLNTSTAYGQGENAASVAAAVAEGQDFSTFDIIYFDLESWPDHSTSCIDAADSFVDGWDYWITVNTPYIPGLYGSSCGSNLSAYWDSLTWNVADIWAADPNDNSGYYNLACMSNSIWNDYQRIHQFTNPITLTYGGYTMPIDEDCVNTLVDSNSGGTINAQNCKYIS
jgi:hypothetical protein